MGKGIGLTTNGGAGYSAPGTSGGGMAGTISLGSVVIRTIGIVPSLGYAPNETWFRGNQWPPENNEPPNGPPPPWPTSLARHFTPVVRSRPAGSPVEARMPPSGWGTYWYAIVLLTEFVQHWKWDPATEAALQARLAKALSDEGQDDEKEEMRKLIEFREGALDELLSQMTNFDAYFQGALGYTHATHPSTDFLVQGAMQVGGFVAMYYKNVFQRARPSQLWPQLMPPIQVPGHAAYPSGHATQANTIAKVLQAVAATAVPSVIDVTTRLAQRIARGREVLGLHYPSDSAAGLFLSEQIADTFLACPTVARLATAARHEWESYRV